MYCKIVEIHPKDAYQMDNVAHLIIGKTGCFNEDGETYVGFQCGSFELDAPIDFPFGSDKYLYFYAVKVEELSNE